MLAALLSLARQLTRCVNLTHGTFICNGCSGVHREFSHKIKGIGHSSFTTEEVAKLRHPESGNEAVNACYLARYDAGTSMPMPRESDQDAIRTWIRTKYIDRKWCERGSPSGGSGSSSRSKSRSAKTGAKSSDRGSNSRRQIMPSTKPVAAPAPAPAEDLFGFDTVAPSIEPASQIGSNWDAFGGSMQNHQSAPAFQADFGNAPPAAQSSAPATTFEADFGNSAQQPTMVAMPSARQTTVQPAFDANFSRTPATTQQQSQSADGFADFPPPTQQHAAQPVQPNGFANFSPQQQTQPQSDGFASFGHSNLEASHAMSVPSQAVPSSQAGISGGQQVNFGQYSQPTGQPQTNAQTQMQAENTVQMSPQQAGQARPQNQMQQQQPSTQLDFGQFPVQSDQQTQAFGFAGFENQPELSQGQANQAGSFANFQGHSTPQQTPTNPPHPAQNQSPLSQDFSGFSSSQPSQSTTKTEPQQSMQLTANQGGQGGIMHPSQPNLNQTANVEDESTNAVALPTGNVATSLPDKPTSVAGEDETNIETKTNPNAFRPSDESKKSAFDAFDNLSLEPSPSLVGVAEPAGAKSNQPPKQSMFIEGQTVVYTNNDSSTQATVKSVHYDDELKPYYTIELGGRERQTDDAHLALPGEVTATSNGDSAVLQKTISMLQSINSEQLLQVQQFIQNLPRQSGMLYGANDGTAGQVPESEVSAPTINSMAQPSPQTLTYPQQQMGMGLKSMGANGTINSQDFENCTSQVSRPQMMHQPQLSMNSLPGQTSQSGPQETTMQHMPAIGMQPMGGLPPSGDAFSMAQPHYQDGMMLGQQSQPPQFPPPMPSPSLPPVVKEGNPQMQHMPQLSQPQMMHQPQLSMNSTPGQTSQSGPQETTMQHMPAIGMQPMGGLPPSGNAFSMAQSHHQDGTTMGQQGQPPQFSPTMPPPSLPPVVKEGNPFDF